MTSPPREVADVATRGPSPAPGQGAFYWALLEGPWTPGALRAARTGVPRSGLEALAYAFEPWLPAPMDTVERRYALVSKDGAPKVVACAIERRRLEALTNGDPDRQTGSIRPSALPAFVARSTGLDEGEAARIAMQLEFRSGAFEPPSARRHRRVVGRLLAGGLALALVASTIANFRASIAMRREARGAALAVASLAASTLDQIDAIEGRAAAPTTLDPRLRLAAELRRLEQTRPPPAPGIAPAPGTPAPGHSTPATLTLGTPAYSPDLTAEFARLLAAWPEDLPARVDQALFEGDGLSLRGQTRTAAEAEQLLLVLSERLSAPVPWTEAIPGGAVPGGAIPGAGWSEQSRGVNKARQGFAFTVAFRASPVRHAAEPAPVESPPPEVSSP